jgi:hypothetical protein
MRTVYATSVEVRSDADVSTSLDYVGRWIHDWYLRQRLSVDVFENLGGEDVTVTPTDGHQLDVRHHTSSEAPGERLIDLRWEYPDQYDKTLGWVVRLALLRRTGSLLLSIDVAVTGLQPVVAPASIKLGSPRVIRDIARLRSVRIGGAPYILTPELVAAEDVELLVSELSDPSRPYPIVLVSRRVQDDVPLVDSGDLADRLAGVAKVYELVDKWSAFRLTEELGKPLSCFAGAVRIYWPRFNGHVDPFAHPVWMPWQFRDADVTERTLGHLFGMVFEAAAFRHVEPAPITLVRLSAEREARKALRSGGSKSTDELLDDLIEMEQKLRAVEATNAELVRDNKTLRDNAAALSAHTAWSDEPTPNEPAPEVQAEPAAPTSIAAAVQLAECKTKSIRFLPSAYTSAADSPYKHPERVLQALIALDEVASIWAETVDSGRPGGSVRQLFKKRGFDYADDVSQTSKGKWGSEYVADYKGQQLDIAPHITIGAKQADICLSIHWAWHKPEKVALVAHVGRHKTNTKT